MENNRLSRNKIRNRNTTGGNGPTLCRICVRVCAATCSIVVCRRIVISVGLWRLVFLFKKTVNSVSGLVKSTIYGFIDGVAYIGISIILSAVFCLLGRSLGVYSANCK